MLVITIKEYNHINVLPHDNCCMFTKLPSCIYTPFFHSSIMISHETMPNVLWMQDLISNFQKFPGGGPRTPSLATLGRAAALLMVVQWACKDTPLVHSFTGLSLTGHSSSRVLSLFIAFLFAPLLTFPVYYFIIHRISTLLYHDGNKMRINRPNLSVSYT